LANKTLFYKYYLPLLTWALIILTLSLLPGNKFPNAPFSGFDIFVHAVFYFLLSFLLARAFFVQFPFLAYYKLLLAAFLIASLFEIGIEIIQEFFIATRTGQLSDIAANTTGITIGLYTTKLYYG